MVWHSGGAAGYSTSLSRFTDHGLSVAVLCNFDPVSATALTGRVADVFLPPVDPQAAPPGPVAAPGVDVTGRAGLYFDERTGRPLRLIANGGRLTIAAGPPLVPVSAERFHPQHAMLFFRSEDVFELTFRSEDAFELTSMEGETTRYRRAEPWTPSAVDLEAVDGRYENRDIGTAFEIVPGPNGVVLRFETAPEKAIELDPVARDTYMRSLMIVRFCRDTSGKVVGFDYGNPVVRSLRFTRIGDRTEDSPAIAAPESPAPAMPDEPVPPLEGLVGEYEMAPGRTLTVTLEDGHLHGEPTGNPKRTLMHVSGTTFSVEETDRPTTVAFILGADGRATALVLRQNGTERTLPRTR